MADDEDLLSGASSATRTFLSSRRRAQGNPVSAESPEANTTNVNAGVAFLRSNYDPSFKSLSIQRAQDFGNDAGDLTAASGAPYGSIASRNDPTRFGSIASREFGDTFGAQGSANAGYQADSKAYTDAVTAPQRQRDNAAATAPIAGQIAAGLQPQFAALFSQLGGMQRKTSTPSVDPADTLKSDDNG